MVIFLELEKSIHDSFSHPKIAIFLGVWCIGLGVEGFRLSFAQKDIENPFSIGILKLTFGQEVRLCLRKRI